MEDKDLWYCIEEPAVDDEGNPTGGVIKKYPNIEVKLVEVKNDDSNGTD